MQVTACRVKLDGREVHEVPEFVLMTYTLPSLIPV